MMGHVCSVVHASTVYNTATVLSRCPCIAQEFMKNVAPRVFIMPLWTHGERSY